ncbi:MAG: Ldh family oxidoreductase [Proteobacteria bacterium]|nr:Ldh family oxidoreductase [Pseudomonadota bacterium]
MAVVLTVEALTDVVAQVLVRHGMSPGNARIVAAVVVAAERDGSRSHGLLRLPGYVATLKSGWVDGTAVPDVVDAAPGLVATDARNGFAQVALAASRTVLEAKARAAGIAALAIRNSHHFAALWPDVEPFAASGFVALAVVNVRSRIVVWGAKRKLLGTNPMAFACPRPGAPPLVWDQASSVVAQGEVLLAATERRPVAPGIGVDAQGAPSVDPRAILDGGAMMPFADHKGSAIAFMVEILAAALTGGRFGFEDRSAAFPGAQTSNAGQCIIVIEPSRTAGNAFGTRVEALIAQLLASGVSRLPGEHRYARRRRALADGIAIAERDHAAVMALLEA